MIDIVDDRPRLERIHTRKHEHQERDRVYRKRAGKCTRKQAYTKKGALTQRSTLLKRGAAHYLRVYKCTRCGYHHLTHLPERTPTRITS